MDDQSERIARWAKSRETQEVLDLMRDAMVKNLEQVKLGSPEGEEQALEYVRRLQGVDVMRKMGTKAKAAEDRRIAKEGDN